ncbi:MAG: VWA domain-containing protein [Bacilli bacterium]|nr:VWA domain-containing protein [Bacilli bacterium]
MGLVQRIKTWKARNVLGILGSIVIVIGFILIIPKAFAISVPVKSITITSSKLDYHKKVPGSYNIEKSAKWLEKGKARITFDLDTIMKTEEKFTDIIFVLDVSGSMSGEKLAKVKTDSIDLINTLLSDSNNRSALITFETTSKIILPLTNDKDKLMSTINGLSTGNMTNYYQALSNVDEILKDYKKEENRECIVLFLTDGYPNEEIPNEEGQYSYLKKVYPYLTINGIQYEMGKEVLEPIKKVSDQQFIADMTNLNNVLFEASIAPSTYNEFLITDYINSDYFEIDGIDSIVASVGTTKLEYENGIPKVIWDIKNLRSGSQAKLTIDVNLKDEYLNKGGLYPTNKKEEVNTEIDKIKEEITSTKTPVLADNYKVIYDGNAPSNCTVQNVPSSITKSVFETVEVSRNIPVCEGYQFKGWSIVTENVKKVNEDYFIMPESDVVIRANWGKMSIAKNIDGEVFTVQTLYNIVEKQASLDNTKSEFVSGSSGINFGAAPSNTNGKGVYTIASTKDYKYPVHYFRGEVTNNNVKFANFCWKIVRTTKTGGVKLVYNGFPNSNGDVLIQRER